MPEMILHEQPSTGRRPKHEMPSVAPINSVRRQYSMVASGVYLIDSASSIIVFIVIKPSIETG